MEHSPLISDEPLRVLVLGGTRFLSHAVAADAVARGHEVTCACRGESGPLPEGVRHVRWDRDEEPPAELAGDWDAVVDVARLPSHVRHAVTALPDAHWVFVSTVSVYADHATVGSEALHEPVHDDLDPFSSPEAYGAMKVACEQTVAEGAASSLVLRPGLIVGPGDPSGRFTYWPLRLARGGEVLAPGDPADVVQVIDVRDLAAWIVTACEQRTTGTLDAVGEMVPLGRLLAEVADGVSSDARLTWVDADVLAREGVEPWAGDDAVPLWLPRPDHDGMMTHDPAPAIADGLVLRALATTATDTLDWARATPDAAVTGISPEREAELLATWRATVRG